MGAKSANEHMFSIQVALPFALVKISSGIPAILAICTVETNGEKYWFIDSYISVLNKALYVVTSKP